MMMSLGVETRGSKRGLREEKASGPLSLDSLDLDLLLRPRVPTRDVIVVGLLQLLMVVLLR
jgi:hypothetical protein